MDGLANFVEREKRIRCSNIIERLRLDRENNENCDIVIKVEDSRFNAHKCLLINASDYFRKMLTGSFVEAGKSEIELKGIVADNFRNRFGGRRASSLPNTVQCFHPMKFVLDFIYGKTTEYDKMSAETVFQVYHLADMFCVDDLTKEFQKFLNNVDQFANGVEWYPLAKKLNHVKAQKRLKTLLFNRLVEESYRHPLEIFDRLLNPRLVNVTRIPYELLMDTAQLFKLPKVTSANSQISKSYVDLLECVPLMQYRVNIILSWIEANPNVGKDKHLALLNSIGMEGLPNYIVSRMLEKAIADGKNVAAELLSEVTKDMNKLSTS